jgi:hypothetical protein
MKNPSKSAFEAPKPASNLHPGTHQSFQMSPGKQVSLTQIPVGEMSLMAIYPCP